MYIGFVNTMYEVVSWVCYKLEENLMQIDSPTTIQGFIRLYEVLSYRMHVFKIFFFLSEKDIFANILISKKKTPTKLLCTGKKIIQLPLRIPIRGNSKTRELLIVIFCVSVHI